MGLEGEGSGGRGGGKWGERGREVGIGYPPVHSLSDRCMIIKINLQCIAKQYGQKKGFFCPF